MKTNVKKLTYSALLFAMAYVLPYLTANIPEIGTMLCPMHVPVFICGFVCGPVWGGAVGELVPFVRSLTIAMPPLYPTAAAMSFELASYGILSGILYRVLPRKTGFIYVTLLVSMMGGRVVWGAARYVMSVVSQTEFGFAAFVSGAITTSLPGTVVQLVLLPAVIYALERAGLIPRDRSTEMLEK